MRGYPSATETSPPTRFGKLLRELRRERGLTPGGLARRVGLSVSAIGGYEAGYRYPPRRRLPEFARALETTEGELAQLLPPRAALSSPFGRALRELREGCGLTQQQLAERVGLRTETIDRYEGASIHPGGEGFPEFVTRLAEALDVPPAEIDESLSRSHPPRVPTDFGHRIRQLRFDRGLTQEQLGMRCGRTAHMIYNYEICGLYPKPSLLPALAASLEVEVSELERLLPWLQGKPESTPFGGELRRLRNQRGWTQRQLAGRADMGAGAISNYETRGAYPKLHTVAALAWAFGVPREQLARLLPPQPETTPLGRELKRLRKERGLLCQELAKQVGCSGSSISAYERGQIQPGVDTSAALARALGVPEERFVDLHLPRAETTRSGRELRRLRQERGLTLQQLAALSGCLPSNLTRYEGGRRRPDPRSRAALALALGVPEQQLQL